MSARLPPPPQLRGEPLFRARMDSSIHNPLRWAESTSSGTTPPAAIAALAEAMLLRHHASQVRSAASRVRLVTSVSLASLRS